jgi:hypothetical protein
MCPSGNSDESHGWRGDPFAAELQQLSQDAAQPERKRKAAARFVNILSRPLLLGIFGEYGAGQLALINNLLRTEICPPAFTFGKRPITYIRYSGVPSMHSITAHGKKYRLTTQGLVRIAQQRQAAAKENAKVIYKAPIKPSPLSQTPSFIKPATAGQEDEIAAIEIQLPLPSLRQLEILDWPLDQPLQSSPRLRQLLKGRGTPDIAAWVTLATGAWKNSEHMTWKSLPVSAKPSHLLLTDCEALNGQTRARLDERLKDSAGSMFLDRFYLSLRDASALARSGREITQAEWQATGIPTFEAALATVSQRIWADRVERMRRLLLRLDRRALNGNRPLRRPNAA